MPRAGRPPKPKEIKEIAGNPGRRELNAAEPKFSKMKNIEPPEHLDALAITEWLRLAPDLVENGLLRESDRASFAAYCVAYSRWVQAEQALSRVKDANSTLNGLAIKGTRNTLVVNPLVRVANDALDLMLKAASEFGMTPAARTKVQAEKQKDENPFENLAAPTFQ